MNWQLSIFLLFTFFVSLARSQCVVSPNYLKTSDNRKGSKNLTDGVSVSNRDTKGKFGKLEQSVIRSIFSHGVATLVPDTSSEIFEQLKSISKEQWKRMLEESIGGGEFQSDHVYTIPPGGSLIAYDLRLVCGVYKFKISELILIKDYDESKPKRTTPPPEPEKAPAAASAQAPEKCEPPAQSADSKSIALEIISLLALHLSL